MYLKIGSEYYIEKKLSETDGREKEIYLKW